MEFSSTAHVNSMIWISSLRETEAGSTRRVLEDLESYFSTIGLAFQHLAPSSAGEFNAILAALAQQAEQGANPIVHLDTHGSQSDGLLISASGECVSWASLVDAFRPINVATRNNLCVVLAACFGLHAINEVKITEPVPFHILIGPQEPVSFGFVEKRTTPFYKAVFDGLEITSSFEQFLSPEFRMFHSEKLLATALARYIREGCRGTAGERRRERLVSEVVQRPGIPNNRATLRKLRKSVRTMTRPDQPLLERLVDTFLIGRTPEFDMAALNRFVDNSIVEEDRARASQRRSRTRRR